jgi:hypothetical protein
VSELSQGGVVSVSLRLEEEPDELERVRDGCGGRRGAAAAAAAEYAVEVEGG